jgi:hypothetical protein
MRKKIARTDREEVGKGRLWGQLAERAVLIIRGLFLEKIGHSFSVSEFSQKFSGCHDK